MTSSSPAKRKREPEPRLFEEPWHRPKRAYLDHAEPIAPRHGSYSSDAYSAREPLSANALSDASSHSTSGSSQTGFAAGQVSHQLPRLRNALDLGSGMHASAPSKDAWSSVPFGRPDGRVVDYSFPPRGDDPRAPHPPRLPPIFTATSFDDRTPHATLARTPSSEARERWSAAVPRTYDEGMWARRSDPGLIRPCPDCESRGARWAHECPHVPARSTLPGALGTPTYSSHADHRRPSLGHDGRPVHRAPQYTWEHPGAPSDAAARRRRGNLPKESTAVLNAWFCAHVAYPYPKEEEKQRLQHETGLTMAQVRLPPLSTRGQSSRRC